MSAALANRRTPRTVRLRMAQDTQRAERIRQLKADHPEMTWGYIADQVGVRERSAIEWQRTGGLDSGNAEKLAEVFGVSYEYLWFGREKPGPAPDLMSAVNGTEQAVEDARAHFSEKVSEHNELLAENNELIKRIVARIEVLERKADRNLEAVVRLLEAMDGLTSETVAQEMERASAVEGPAERSTQSGIAGTPGATQG